MGLLQPSNIAPSTKAGIENSVCTLHPSFIKWDINGDVPMTGFKLDFYKNDTNSTFVVSTNLVTIAPFYGKDGEGNYNTFNAFDYLTSAQKTDITHNVKYNYDGIIGEYKYRITQYWGANQEYSVGQIDFNILYCVEANHVHLETPVITRSGFVAKITAEKYHTVATLDITGYSIRTEIYENLILKEILQTKYFPSYNIDYIFYEYPDIGKTPEIFCKNQFGNIASSGSVSLPAPTFTTTGLAIMTKNEDYVNFNFTTWKDIQVLEMIENPNTAESKSYFYYFGWNTGFGYNKMPIYSFKSGVNYDIKFYNIYQGLTKIGVANSQGTAISSFCYNFNEYRLILTQITTQERGVNCRFFLKMWKFGNNISTSSISNNNQPSFFENFTGYRLKQHSSRKGRSGTLSALLSNTVDYDYNDTVEQMKELFNLSLENQDLFLLTPKGDYIKVAISQPIVQTINDKNKKRQVTVQLGWEEVGDATQYIIVGD